MKGGIHGAVYIRRKLYKAKIKVLNLGEHFDNKRVYFGKNTPNFPDDIDKKRLKATKPFVGSRLPVGLLAIIGSNFRKEPYPLKASAQHVVATAAVTILPLICFLNNITCVLNEAME